MDENVFQDCLNRQRTSAGMPFWADLAEKWGYESKEKLRHAFRTEKNKRGIVDDMDLYAPSETLDYLADGSIVSQKLIQISAQQLKSQAWLLTAHGFDPKEWKIVSAKNNLWNGMRPDDKGLIGLYQSKITVAPCSVGLSLSDVDKFFQTFSSEKMSKTVHPKRYNQNGYVVEIALADIHVGNGNAPKGTPSISEKVDAVITDVIFRAKDLPISKIVLVQLGDILHYDTYKRTTTSGTQITSGDNTNASIFDEAAAIMISAIDRLQEVAPVEVIGIYGNHDRVSSYTLMKSIEFYYRNNVNVLVDAGHNPKKFRKFGNNLVFWQHGDMPKKNVRDLIFKEARKEFGETKFAEIHLGNFHHQQTLEEGGVIIRYLPSITHTDEWHESQGYTGAIQTTVSFLWDLEYGLKEMWFS